MTAVELAKCTIVTECRSLTFLRPDKDIVAVIYIPRLFFYIRLWVEKYNATLSFSSSHSSSHSISSFPSSHSSSSSSSYQTSYSSSSSSYLSSLSSSSTDLLEQFVDESFDLDMLKITFNGRRLCIWNIGAIASRTCKYNVRHRVTPPSLKEIVRIEKYTQRGYTIDIPIWNRRILHSFDRNAHKFKNGLSIGVSGRTTSAVNENGIKNPAANGTKTNGTIKSLENGIKTNGTTKRLENAIKKSLSIYAKVDYSSRFSIFANRISTAWTFSFPLSTILQVV